jgi:hypothetical protein
MFGVSWTSVGVSTQETIKGLAAAVLCNASAQWRGAFEQEALPGWTGSPVGLAHGVFEAHYPISERARAVTRP